GVEEDVGGGGRPSYRYLLVLVMGEAVDARAHDHCRRGDPVDPAGIVAGAGDDVARGVAETPGGIAHRLDAARVELDRIEVPDRLNLDGEAEIGGDLRRFGFDPRFHAVEGRLVGRTDVDGEDDLAGDDV